MLPFRSKRSNKNAQIMPWELNPEGGGGGRGQFALVLRYAGCQLRCPLCYALRYAWNLEKHLIIPPKKVLDNLKNLDKAINLLRPGTKIGWIRIQGGEPCLNIDRTIWTIRFGKEAIKQIHNQNLNKFNITRCIIQTNGIIFANLNSNELNTLKEELQKACKEINDIGRIIFEVSFKSPCIDGYQWRKFDQPVLILQIRGFRTLLNVAKSLWNEDLINIAIYPVAGLGPSIDEEPWLIPIETSYLPEELPLFHPRTWSPDFKENVLDTFLNIVNEYENVYDDYKKNKKTDNGSKIPLEELEPSPFQSGWLSYYKKNPEKSRQVLPQVLRKMSDKPPKGWKLFIKNYNDVLKLIPKTSDPQEMMTLVEDLKKCFYPTHPRNHYPYL